MSKRPSFVPLWLAWSLIWAAAARAQEANDHPHAPQAEPPAATQARPQAVAAPAPGERIVFVGNGLAERDVYFSRLETELHLRYPEHRLVVRNLGRPGDTPGFRPHPARVSQWAFPGAEKFHPELDSHFGKGFFPTPDQWLTHLRADTILAFFGYNESFAGPAGVANFAAELEAWVRHTLARAYNGAAAPRLVLVAPLAFENLSAQRDLPDGTAENANLALYAGAMQAVARRHGLTFVDFFGATRARYASRPQPPLTINGFAPTEAGYAELAAVLADAAFGPQPRRSKADPALVNAAVKEKDYFWNNDYNLVNGVHTHGQRYNPFGPQNYPDELRKTREMMALRDARLQEIAAGRARELAVDDSRTHALPAVPTNFKRAGDYLDGTAALAKMTVLPGYKVGLFASEKEFPDLKKPVQMSFDNRGRLWVAVTPAYPHYKPGESRPNDKLLIFEDTDGDGRADRQTVFADRLHLPIGFELAPEGVYLSQEPNLCLLVDADGDDKADRMDILMHGFDTHDTHHAISAYTADASGAFYLLEGRFLHSQVETPYGPQRVNDGGAWRFDPKRFRLERFIQSDVNNPWGMAFDDWEQGVLSDASSGENYWALPISAKMPYGVEIQRAGDYVPKRSRPTSGSEFVSSRHFPDDRQGQFMTCNSIGFLGLNFSSVRDDGSGFTGELAGDLISSSDPNFRPVDLEFAPDGSLYFLDWHNALIGHMQHNARDPKRDHEHGRIYRVTYPARPLVKPAKVAGATIPELLENLKSPEYRTRYRTRRELRGRPAREVIPAAKAWAARLDPADPLHDRHLCEAMWATWAQNRPDAGLILAALNARSPQARAAAAQVLRYTAHQLPNGVALLRQAANDPHGRVRLTALVAASWLDNADGARVILEALRHPFDKWMSPVAKQILETTLKDDVAALVAAEPALLAENPQARAYLAGELRLDAAPPAADQRAYGPTRPLTAAEAKVYALGKEVFHRDAHCATCHQPAGTGTPGIYPPLNVPDNPWLAQDDRLIKVALKGLWGPLDIAGRRFAPTNGVPPMIGFAGLLTDEEIAAVLSYVRQSFGNELPFITPAQVAQVRAATKARADFYMVEELMREHPIPGWETWGRMARPKDNVFE
jgi:mono/diheme cytochrome c family protein/glucose/arabinose dehydrogenase